MSAVIVGLDIGTSFVRAIIGEITDESKLQIIGFGKAASTGLRKGAIINIEATVKALSEAIESAELLAGVEVFSCLVSIGGNQIEGLNQKGVVPITNKGKGYREIARHDIERAIETAKAVVIPMDKQILHVVPQTYKVDDVEGIKDPFNHIGVRLEVSVHIITSAITAVQNIKSCISRAGYSLSGVMLKTLAATQAVLTSDEMELGSIIVDFGGGTTDVLVLYEGAPVCCASIPVGGVFVTRDISIVKCISMESAEKVKKSSGCCWRDMIEDYEDVLIPGVGGRPPEVITKAELCDIIQARMQEILIMVRKEIISKSIVNDLSGNIVLTGGGALLPGIVELTQQVFATSAVRVGNPTLQLHDSVAECKSPEYATVLGLVMSAAPGGALDHQGHLATKRNNKYNDQKQDSKPFGKRLVGYLKEFF